MSDWPNLYQPTLPVFTPWSLDLQGATVSASAANFTGGLGSSSSAVWTVANKAYFYPFRLHEFAVAYQLLFWVGATSNGNIDVGIYDSQKNLIISSGSTAMSATVNTVQELNITNTELNPGEYLLAGACSSATGTCFQLSTGDELALPVSPVYEQTSALALPNPCTPVLCTDGSPPRVAIGIQFVPTF